MAVATSQIVPLAKLVDGQDADFFALLSDKQSLTTKDGKPYFRVTFRDAERDVSFPIWSDSAWAVACRDQWTVGQFFKMRAALKITTYGPQLEIRKIRLVEEGDAADGFDPMMCQPASQFDPEEMFDELVATADQRIEDEAFRQLVVDILQQHREELVTLPAAVRNHHAYLGGFLEHVLNVTRTCCYLAEKYTDLYADLDPPLNTDVVVAGAILHDIGKLRELAQKPGGAEYTPAGTLIGHVLQGRDIVREAAVGRDVDPDMLLRLEHVIVSHQRLPEWGAPKPPMTPEALLVHYADDIDAKMQMMVAVLKDETIEGPITSRRNVLGQPVYRGV